LRGSALTPLIGRDEEIDLMLRRWARAKGGDGQVVLVSGEPGIGKSRITRALEERLHDKPHIRLRYFSSPYHQESALYPFIDRSVGRRGSSATIRPQHGWRSSKPCWPAPRRRTRMSHSSPI
jgi:predicted ATPase